MADEATTKRVTPDFFREHSLADLRERSDHWLGQQGRLTHPMVKRAGATHYEPIAWDEAFKLIARELNALPTPNAAAFYTSGRTSNEAAFLYQLFARQFGTNNLPDCSNMCHESSGAALERSDRDRQRLRDAGRLRAGRRDFHHRPESRHESPADAFQFANARRQNGAKIVSINPMPEIGNFRFKNPQDFKNPLRAAGAAVRRRARELSDLWLPVRINGDVGGAEGDHEGNAGRGGRSGPARSSIAISSATTRLGSKRSSPISARRAGTTSSSAAA